jgi:phage/plasmid-like protein (TIGR03299 family)
MHGIEFIEGKPSFVQSARTGPAWHGLGENVDGLTYAQAMTRANLEGWNVRTVPLTVNIDGVNYDLKDRQLTVRNNPATGAVEPIAPTGGRYKGVQNEQAFAVAAHLEALGATVETAGSLNLGSRVFMSLMFNKGFVIDPDGAGDTVQGYLLLSSSHDGSLAVEACSTWVRVVCANTLDMALPGAERAYKIRHTANAEIKLAEAQEIFLMANGYGDALAEEARALFETDTTSAEFFDIVSRVYPKPGSPESKVKESKRGLTVWEKKVDTLQGLFTGRTIENIGGTAWGALNALTERLDWGRTARGGDGTSLLEAASGFSNNIAGEKALAREVVVDFAREKNPAAFATV